MLPGLDCRSVRPVLRHGGRAAKTLAARAPERGVAGSRAHAAVRHGVSEAPWSREGEDSGARDRIENAALSCCGTGTPECAAVRMKLCVPLAVH